METKLLISLFTNEKFLTLVSPLMSGFLFLVIVFHKQIIEKINVIRKKETKKDTQNKQDFTKLYDKCEMVEWKEKIIVENSDDFYSFLKANIKEQSLISNKIMFNFIRIKIFDENFCYAWKKTILDSKIHGKIFLFLYFDHNSNKKVISFYEDIQNYIKTNEIDTVFVKIDNRI